MLGQIQIPCCLHQPLVASASLNETGREFERRDIARKEFGYGDVWE